MGTKSQQERTRTFSTLTGKMNVRFYVIGKGHLCILILVLGMSIDIVGI